MCDERERLIGYVYDECDAGERRVIDGHLESCEVCRDEIRGLRDVREDLLAWDVPDHGSVWQPFAPAAAPPWWRQVPAWAMAAAASVMFMAGAMGGAVTHSMLAKQDRTAATTTAEQRAPASVTPADLSAAEQRIAASLRAEVAERFDAYVQQRPETTRVSARSGVGGSQLRGESAVPDPEEMWRILTLVANDLSQVKKAGRGAAMDRRDVNFSTVNFAPGPSGR